MLTLSNDQNATTGHPERRNPHPGAEVDPAETIETEVATCGTCGKAFRASILRSPFDASRIILRQRHCDPCTEAEMTRRNQQAGWLRQQEAEATLAAEWNRICPLEFRTTLEGGPTQVARLEQEQPALAEILRHPLGPQGLILRGRTDAGKTRCMYRLLRLYHVQQPRPKIVAVTAGQFDRQARDAAGSFTLSAWFDGLARADVLFIDDLGKGRWTPATAGQFWELVDDRTRNGRPLFLTTNVSGESLGAALGLDRDIVEPLVRRLREHCKALILKR